MGLWGFVDEIPIMISSVRNLVGITLKHLKRVFAKLIIGFVNKLILLRMIE
jgi:hypothetical protein